VSERWEGDEDGEMRALARDRGKTGAIEATVAELDERVSAALTGGAGVFGVSNTGQRGERRHEEFAALRSEQATDRDRALERGRDVKVAALVPGLLRRRGRLRGERVAGVGDLAAEPGRVQLPGRRQERCFRLGGQRAVGGGQLVEGLRDDAGVVDRDLSGRQSGGYRRSPGQSPCQHHPGPCGRWRQPAGRAQKRARAGLGRAGPIHGGKQPRPGPLEAVDELAQLDDLVEQGGGRERGRIVGGERLRRRPQLAQAGHQALPDVLELVFE